LVRHTCSILYDTVFVIVKNMRWHDQLQEWKSGNVPTNPLSLSIPTPHGANTGRYFFETSPIDSLGDNEHHETFIWSPALDRMSYDPTPFRDYLLPAEQKDPYISIFFNQDRSAVLCIPVPKRGKQFTTMKEFIDTASPTHQRYFWKKVACEIERQLQKSGYDQLYVSTHGLGVSYFHLRIEPTPKYYQTQEYK
jgi:hypothetical protein